MYRVLGSPAASATAQETCLITTRSFTVIAVRAYTAGSLLILALAASPPAARAGLAIEAADLRPLFSGSDAHLDMTGRAAHGWTNALWKFSADGSLSGYLFTSAYTARQEPENALDSGKWWVSQNRLCLQWRKWDNGQKRCYLIARQGRSYTALGASGLFNGRFTLVGRK